MSSDDRCITSICNSELQMIKDINVRRTMILYLITLYLMYEMYVVCILLYLAVSM